MKKIGIIFLLVSMLLGILTGCSENSPEYDENSFLLYQVEENGNGLKKTSYEIQSDQDDVVGVIKELLSCYKKIDVRDFEMKEKQLSLYFSSAYKNFQGIDEVLLRAALVKTLCQLDDIEYVEFFVEGVSLQIEGEPIGVMSELSFMDSIGGDGYTQNKYVTLYFANQSGEELQEINTKMTYDMTVPLARLLVEQLLEGPEELPDVNTSDLVQTIPDGTTLNSLTIRDNVCYVDFSSAFENIQPQVKSSVVIFSVVNTLCELSDVSKVQFTINGEQKERYGDTVEFDSPFERNLDLVSGSSKG